MATAWRELVFWLRGRTASGRFTVLPIMIGLAAPYVATIAIYLAQAGKVSWLPVVPWGLVLGKAALSFAGPITLTLVWLRVKGTHQVIWAYDWIGGWMVAYAMGGTGNVVHDLLRPAAPGTAGTIILIWGAAAWVMVGTALLVSGGVALTTVLQSERSERKRLEALMRFTRQIASLDLRSTLNAAVRELYQLLHADACILYLWNEQEQVLVPEAGLHTEDAYTQEYIDRMMSFRCPLGHGMTGAVMETGQPVLSGNVQADPRTAEVPGYRMDPKSTIVAPLVVEDRRVGVVRLTRRGVDQFTQEDLDLTLSFAGQVALMIEHVRVLEELSVLTVTDSLTGLYNARQFRRTLERETTMADRSGGSLSLVMMDSDSLKPMNDRLGHQAGDLYLKQIAEVIRDSIRRTDFAFRYAGDEFLLVLPQTGPEVALQVAERIRRGVERLGHAPHVAGTISLGVATFPVHATTPEGLLAAADEAMYRSKRSGKNRTTVAPQAVANSMS